MANAPMQQGMIPHGERGLAGPWFTHDVVVCKKKILAIAPTFEIFDAGGTSLVYCREKLFKIKDDIRIYADSSKNLELLRVRQRNLLDWAGLFDVIDSASGVKLGALRRKGWRSWLRDEWHLLDANDVQVGRVLESGTPLLRRIFKFLPYSFALILGGQQVGSFDQHFTFFGYRATMNLAGWRQGPLDRRMAFAAALLLMAVEAKEDRER